MNLPNSLEPETIDRGLQLRKCSCQNLFESIENRELFLCHLRLEHGNDRVDDVGWAKKGTLLSSILFASNFEILRNVIW